MWDQSGGYFVPLELQARWIAYTWGGAVAAPSEAEQRLSINAYRSRRGTPQKTQMNVAALTFARAAGVEPRLDNWPQLRRALLFGPLAPSLFPARRPGCAARRAGTVRARRRRLRRDHLERADRAGTRATGRRCAAAAP